MTINFNILKQKKSEIDPVLEPSCMISSISWSLFLGGADDNSSHIIEIE